MEEVKKKVVCPKCGESRTLDECLNAGEPLHGVAEGFKGVAYGFLRTGRNEKKAAYMCYTCGEVWFE